MPLRKWLEFQLAVRHERYSDFGETTKPKYSGKVRLPANRFVNVLLRGSWSESFKAPDIGQLYQPQSFAVTSASISDPLRPQDGARQLRVLVGGNPALKPEEGTVQYAGAVFEVPAVKGLSFSVVPGATPAPLTHILIATGSELQLAVAASKTLGSGTRVVSLPCTSRFDRQSALYRESVLPSSPTTFHCTSAPSRSNATVTVRASRFTAKPLTATMGMSGYAGASRSMSSSPDISGIVRSVMTSDTSS